MTESATKVDDSMFGGNASAEGGAEEAAVDGPDKSGCNIVLANRLQGTTYTKKDYQTHIKVLLQKLLSRSTSYTYMYMYRYYFKSMGVCCGCGAGVMYNSSIHTIFTSVFHAIHNIRP